jgi:hypothetical protein
MVLVTKSCAGPFPSLLMLEGRSRRKVRGSGNMGDPDLFSPDFEFICYRKIKKAKVFPLVTLIRFWGQSPKSNFSLSEL